MISLTRIITFKDNLTLLYPGVFWHQVHIKQWRTRKWKCGLPRINKCKETVLLIAIDFKFKAWNCLEEIVRYQCETEVTEYNSQQTRKQPRGTSKCSKWHTFRFFSFPIAPLSLLKLFVWSTVSPSKGKVLISSKKPSVKASNLEQTNER